MAVTISAAFARRLETEQVVWLTTVRADGMPQPTPVWFVWDGESFLIYSRPATQKLKNIAGNPRIALNFNSDAQGNEVFIVWGEATVDATAPLVTNLPAYVEKYREGIKDIGMTPEVYANTYSVAIRIRPLRIKEMNTL